MRQIQWQRRPPFFRFDLSTYLVALSPQLIPDAVLKPGIDSVFLESYYDGNVLCELGRYQRQRLYNSNNTGDRRKSFQQDREWRDEAEFKRFGKESGQLAFLRIRLGLVFPTRWGGGWVGESVFIHKRFTLREETAIYWSRAVVCKMISNDSETQPGRNFSASALASPTYKEPGRRFYLRLRWYNYPINNVQVLH